MPARPPILLQALTLAFGAAVGMWIVGYLTHFPGIQAAAWVTAGLMGVVQLGMGVVAARCVVGGRAFKLAALGGVFTSLINLLIVGSVIAGEEGYSPNWAALLGGTLAFGPAVSLVGCAVGSAVWRAGSGVGAAGSGDDLARVWLGRFAIVAALSAVPVLASGGIVTSAKAGLAVNNWPGTFEADLMFLYPLQDMTGGIYYEHAHRLFGSLVGLTTLVFMVLTLRYETRRWARRAVVVAFVAVCLQGVLGGLGVQLAQDDPDAIAHAAGAEEVAANFAAATDTALTKAMRAAHGVTAQLTFAYLCLCAAFLSRRWRREDVGAKPADRVLRLFATASAHLLVVQLVVAAILRHYQNPMGSFHLHLTLAAVIAVAASVGGLRAATRHESVLARLGWVVVGTLVLQVALGFVAMMAVMPTYGEAPTAASLVFGTLHQLNGAFLFAAVWTLEVMARRLVDRRPAGGEAVAGEGEPAPA